MILGIPMMISYGLLTMQFLLLIFDYYVAARLLLGDLE